MAAERGAIVTFIFNGETRNDIPRNVTHFIIHERITVIPACLFYEHPNLVEVYCHAGVVKIEQYAFNRCPSLRRVIIPGVIIIEEAAFIWCRSLKTVECGKLETIENYAFSYCKSLSSINLPSAKIVERCAFYDCPMTEAIFGKDLECIEGWAFINCRSLKRITIPLKKGLLTEDTIFTGCASLKRVDLIEGVFLRDFADALLLEGWSDDVNGTLDSINQILSDTAAGEYVEENRNNNNLGDLGGKAIAIREWIEGVLRKVTDYKTAHRELLNEAAAALQLFLPTDTVINNILPFVELPPHTAFEGGRGDDDWIRVRSFYL